MYQIKQTDMTTPHKFDPFLTVVYHGQFYDVSYSVYDRGVTTRETQSFRTYAEASAFFNSIPLN